MNSYEKDFYNQMTEAIYESMEEVSYQICKLIEENNAELSRLIELVEKIKEDDKNND